MGYNPQLFQMGMNLASNPNVWDQPFQDPYASPEDGMGGGGGGFDPAAMGGAPPPEQNNAWPQAQGMEQGPTPTQDLNHPFWSQVGQYLGSDSFKDSLMGGVIAGQMAYDPQGALRLAMQFKEQRDRRKWQTQQNEMQRQAVAENVKVRAEAEKENKKVADFRKNLMQDAANLRTAGVDPQGIIDAVGGEVTPENYPQAKLLATQAIAHSKGRNQAFTEAYKTGVIPDAYASDQMVSAAANVGAERTRRANERLELSRSREEQLRKLRTSKATLPDIKLQSQNLHANLTAVERDIDRYEQNIAKIENNGTYAFLPDGSPQRAAFDRMIGQFQQSIADAETKRGKLLERWDDLVEVRGEKTPSSLTPESLVKGQSSAKAKSGFSKALARAQDESTKQSLIREWQSQYTDAPPTGQ